MKKTALIAIAALLVIAPAAGEAAKAGKVKKSCPKEALCLWTKKDFKGKRMVVKDKGVTNLPKAFNNRVSSLKSRYTGGDDGLSFFFDKKNASDDGDFRCYNESIGKQPDLSGPLQLFDNRGSSVLLPKNEGPVCI
jgi:hypothetical protein